MWFSVIPYGYNTYKHVLLWIIRGNHGYRQEWQYIPLRFQEDFSLAPLNSNMPETIYAVWRTNIKIMTYGKRQQSWVPLIVFKVIWRILGLETSEINANIWCKTLHFISLTTSMVLFLEYYTAIMMVKEVCNNVHSMPPSNISWTSMIQFRA